MAGNEIRKRMAADVKCYHCGHISGMIVGYRGEPVRVENFLPAPGYQGKLPCPGETLRCDRCNGPVFLEDAGAMALVRGSEEYRALLRAVKERQRAA